MKFTYGLFIFALIFSTSACTKHQQENTPAASSEQKTLNVYSWSNYFSDELIKAFEEKTKTKVVFTYFSSNEELFAKLSAGATGYDVIVPSGYILKAMKDTGLIQPLGKLDWQELANLNAAVKKSNYDPQMEYGVPYQMGLTGLAVNKAKVKGKVDSLSWIFDHPELKNSVALLDDAPVVIGFALKYLGYSYNESSDAALVKAKQLLIKSKKNIKIFTSEPIPLLENGEVAIAQSYSGDTVQLNHRIPSIEFVHAKEGGELFMDYLAIPKDAPHSDLAKEFIHLSLDKKLAAAQMLRLLYMPVVNLQDVPSVLPVLKNSALFPNDEILKKYELLEDSSERHDKLERLWTEIKSS